MSAASRQPSGASGVACGSRFTVFANRSGEVFSSGRNEDGQLGHGDRAAQLSPRLVEALAKERIIAVSSLGGGEGGGLNNFDL